ncbi:hypothetical protein Pint_05961 [Pistacia integerrima]|uniref:Uncharacterized protein n=1 Tax=Pistacia integerrima TaxID=434235 RepID=A0ACC0Z462_9ROSI|nr:hypothetical protein Pint_05961 [Pistacia integerrima]
MEEQCSPLGWGHCYQEERIEELRHLYRTWELEATILSAKEEIERREIEFIHLKDVLNKTIKERNEAQTQCQKLMLENLLLQQQLQKQQQQQEPRAQVMSRTSSSDDESKPGDILRNQNLTLSPITNPVLSELPQEALNLAADRPLPVKGKLLKAVMEAGPLLQTLLLAGPLPQWQHPPPQLDSVEIPPVAISSSPSPRLRHHQSSFNSPTAGCLSKKRGLEFGEFGFDSSPKYQKVAPIN